MARKHSTRWDRWRGCLWCLNTRKITTDARGPRPCPFCDHREDQ